MSIDRKGKRRRDREPGMAGDLSQAEWVLSAAWADGCARGDQERLLSLVERARKETALC